MASSLRIRFGRAVAHLRKTETDYSQESLARAAKMHRTYMGLIERGIANPTLDVVDNVARALKVPPERLFKDPESRR
jgi:XRE family transcriptional regulator, regulator of sulfur utilization